MNPTSVAPKPYQGLCGLIYFPDSTTPSLRKSIIFVVDSPICCCLNFHFTAFYRQARHYKRLSAFIAIEK